MKKAFFVLSVILLFACSSSNSPEKTLEKYFRSSMEGTISENTNLFANDDGTLLSEKAAKDLVGLVNGIREYKMKNLDTDHLSVDEIEIVDAEYNEAKTKAKLTYKVTLNGETDEDPSHQYFIKVGDEWKVVLMVRGTSWLER